MCRLQEGKVHTGKSSCAKYNWQTTHGQNTSLSKYQSAKYWLAKYDRQNRRRAKYYTGKLTGVQPTNDRLTVYEIVVLSVPTSFGSVRNVILDKTNRESLFTF